jgi:IS30 family transposase
LSHDEGLRTLVAGKLLLDWSPEQIAAHLREAYPEQPAWHVCTRPSTRRLYNARKSGLSRALTLRLRSGRPLRKRRRRSTQRQVRFIAPARLIDQRPEEVETRERIGDWEGDLIVGRMNQSAIGTLVERRSRYVRLLYLPRGHTADDLCQAMATMVAAVPDTARLTLTWDQGSELAQHDLLAAHFAEGIYFAYPARPWMRGSNENMN